jgi:hypothetical protein
MPNEPDPLAEDNATEEMPAIGGAYRTLCRKRFPLPSESQVAELEEHFGVGLPPDYRRYVLKFNGGYFTEPRIIPPSMPSNEKCPLDRLTVMYGMNAAHDSAELIRGPSVFDDNYPVEALPIGYTMMGNMLVLITHPEERGTILLKRASSDDYFLLADGIDDFFRLLSPVSQ